MKKFISSLLILFLVFNSLAFTKVSASDTNLQKQVIITKYELQKTKKWKTYASQIDQIVEKLSENPAKLKKLKVKLDKIDKSKIYKNKELNDVINYLEVKVSYELSKTSSLVEKVEDTIEDLKTSEISLDEKKEVNKRLNDLTVLLNNNLEKLSEELFKKIDEYYYKNMESNWDFQTSLNSNFWENQLNLNLSISDYRQIVSWEDYSFKWDIDFSFDWYDQNIELKTFLEAVLKENDVYLKMKDLYLSDEDILSYYKSFYDSAKEVFDEDKFIKFGSELSSFKMSNIETIEDTVNKEIENLSKLPLLKAVSKIEDNKYLLEPTIEFCNFAKKINDYFDPFYGDSCSESQYKDMIEWLKEMWYIYMDISNTANTTIGFKEISNQWDFYVEMKYSSNSIDEVNYMTDYWNLYMDLEYVKNNKFSVSIKDNYSYDINFDSELQNSKIKNFVFSAKEKDKEVMKLELKENNIDWFIKIENSRYSYYDDTNYTKVYKMDIDWKLTNDKKISNLELNYNYNDSRYENDLMNWELSFGKYDINGNTYFFDELWNELISVKTQWLYSSETLNLDNDIIVNSYLLDNWKRDAKTSKVYSDINNISKYISIEMAKWVDLSKIVDENNKVNYDLLKINKEDYINPITWEEYLVFTKVWWSWVKAHKFYQVYWVWYDYKWNHEAIIIGTYYKMDSSFPESLVVIDWKVIQDYDIVKELEIDKKDNYKVDFDIDYDMKNNKNNLEIIIDMMKENSNDKIIEFKLKNEWKLFETNWEIKAPENFEDYKDVFQMNDYYYYY